MRMIIAAHTEYNFFQMLFKCDYFSGQGVKSNLVSSTYIHGLILRFTQKLNRIKEKNQPKQSLQLCHMLAFSSAPTATMMLPSKQISPITLVCSRCHPSKIGIQASDPRGPKFTARLPLHPHRSGLQTNCHCSNQRNILPLSCFLPSRLQRPMTNSLPPTN